MVGKRRNKSDQWLPPRVYRGKSQYEYRPKSGETIKLGKVPKDKIETEQVKADVWAEYARVKSAPAPILNVNALIDAYHCSPEFRERAVNTQTDYNGYSKRIRRVFGHMLPEDVEPHDIRSFMDSMTKDGKKKVTANRHHSYLSILFGWGLERNWLKSNPAKSVRKFKETPRDRYITDDEYRLVLEVARQSAYPYVAPMMEIAYLCRARTIEIRALTENELLDDGIKIVRTKGSLGEVTQWSPRLIAAVEEARRVYPSAPTKITRPLFHGKRGAPIPASTFKTAWSRIMPLALKAGLKERFTFHDIKAKGVTDHKSKAGGHKTKKAAAVYDRLPKKEDSTR